MSTINPGDRVTVRKNGKTTQGIAFTPRQPVQGGVIALRLYPEKHESGSTIDLAEPEVLIDLTAHEVVKIETPEDVLAALTRTLEIGLRSSDQHRRRIGVDIIRELDRVVTARGKDAFDENDPLVALKFRVGKEVFGLIRGAEAKKLREEGPKQDPEAEARAAEAQAEADRLEAEEAERIARIEAGQARVTAYLRDHPLPPKPDYPPASLTGLGTF